MTAARALTPQRDHRLRRPPFAARWPAAGRLNPYKVGIELYRDIEERWNKGQFGKEYDECDDSQEARRWNTGTGLGREKIFEVRTHPQRRHLHRRVPDARVSSESTSCSRFGYNTRQRGSSRSRAASSLKVKQQRCCSSLTNIAAGRSSASSTATTGTAASSYASARF